MKRTEKIKVLQDLVQLHTVNGNEIVVAQYLQSLLVKHGIQAKIDAFGDNRADLVAEIGDADPTKKVLAFTGHQDTVAVGNIDSWKHDPFAAEVSGDRLYGRGASDMKSGLAAIAIALIELSENDEVKLKGKLRFIATAGEEYGTPGAYRLNEQHVIDDADALVVGEPTNGNVSYAHSGSFNYRIKSTGKSAHSSTPTEGINAIQGLINYINVEKDLFADTPTDPYLGEVQHSITVINGGEQVNTIPDQAELLGNIRPTREFNNQKVIERITGAVNDLNAKNDVQLELEIIHNFEPVETDSEHEFVQLAKKAAQDNFTDREVKLQTMNGATDASVFVKNNPGLPTVVLGADNSKTDHQLNEYTTLSSYLELIEVYQQIAENFLK